MKLLYLMGEYWWVFAILFGVSGTIRLMLSGLNIQ